MSCEYEKSIENLIDNKISEDEKKKLYKHATECIECSTKLRKIQAVDQIIKNQPDYYNFRSHKSEIIHKVEKDKNSIFFLSILYKSRKYAYALAIIIILVVTAKYIQHYSNINGNTISSAVPSPTIDNTVNATNTTNTANTANDTNTKEEKQFADLLGVSADKITKVIIVNGKDGSSVSVKDKNKISELIQLFSDVTYSKSSNQELASGYGYAFNFYAGDSIVFIMSYGGNNYGKSEIVNQDLNYDVHKDVKYETSKGIPISKIDTFFQSLPITKWPDRAQ